jgi:hypothetical protein
MITGLGKTLKHAVVALFHALSWQNLNHDWPSPSRYLDQALPESAARDRDFMFPSLACSNRYFVFLLLVFGYFTMLSVSQIIQRRVVE